MSRPQFALKGKTVLCGFSGGADSLYLLFELKHRSPDEGFALKAVHFNHGFRGAESDGDELFCRAICEREHIPFLCFALDVPRNRLPGEGDEAAARRLRLQSWKKLTSDGDCVVALAHHGGDVAENLFLRLCRGSNSGGLSSLREFSAVDGIRFWRPLLKLSKADIVRSLSTRGITWRTDSTNGEDICFRNYLRNTLLPGLYQRVPFAEKGILQSVAVLAEDADFLNQAAVKALRSGFCWKELHPAILIRVLRLFLKKQTGKELIPTHDFAETFTALLHKEHLSGGKVLSIPGTENYVFRFRDGYDPVLERKTTDFIPVSWEWRKEESAVVGNAVFSAEILPVLPDTIPAEILCIPLQYVSEPLIFRCRKTGDKMKVSGHKAPVPIAKLFSDAKMSAEERDSFPLLISNADEILWVPGIRKHTVADCGAGPWLKIKFQQGKFLSGKLDDSGRSRPSDPVL